MKLMIIDDEPVVLQGLNLLMDWEALGYEPPLMLPNAVEALKQIEAFKPDVLVTDINMPGLSGLELIEQLRDQGWRKPIIVISGYDEFDYAKQAIKYHVEDYLLKPIDEDELYHVLERLALAKSALGHKPPCDYEAFLEGSIEYDVLYYINHNYWHQIRLKTMAEEFHMTSAYLGQVIKKATGMLFNDYLLKIRMTKAKAQLRSSNAMVYQVAETCGFADTDYFIKKFTAQIGCSPNTYKKKGSDGL